MSQLLQAAAEARTGNLKLLDKFRQIANKFLNHFSARKPIYILRLLPLTPCSRDNVLINTSSTRVEILKPISQIELLLISQMLSHETEIDIDEIDNNVEHLTPGTEYKLPDGYRLVRRTTLKIIRYVIFNIKKDPELHY
ncbi:LOW QUALITY PROTEIN: hypothetical protein MAR_018358 [Mya arenaria]|uniref:Uncharacterized protein n=1 Tax=Mya arenaria TaxID=6604 RepID=A0ABY7EEV9_MYAAR|nr:LOW QUALITY PROTEIN: hypothetical protein MAR_018358 [Mya arenaria]